MASTIRSVEHHFGITLSENVFADVSWTTAHADMHWGNLRRPQLCILDWESWRPMFAGYDLATLYCNSLLHPATARRIRDMPELHTRSGGLALLSAICATSGSSAKAATGTSSNHTSEPKPSRFCPA